MEPAFLNDRAVLAISGPDRHQFLQGLVTNDVVGLAPGMGVYAALLSPQGKILFDFLLTEGDGVLLLDVARDSRQALQKKLNMYRLRSKVTIEPRDQLGVYVDLARDAGSPIAAYDDPRHPKLGRRSSAISSAMPAALPGPGAYHQRRWDLGIPEAGDFGFEKIFAMDAGLAELNGISFTKGCYIGQELTSRMKHRATSRKRILTVTANVALPAEGVMTRGGTEIGELISSHGKGAFALIRLDRLDESSGDIAAAGIAANLHKPAWLT